MVNNLMSKCYDWWESLTEEEQSKIMTDYYPTEVNEDTNIDKMFGDMSNDVQLWIYRREKQDDHLPVSQMPRKG